LKHDGIASLIGPGGVAAPAGDDETASFGGFPPLRLLADRRRYELRYFRRAVQTYPVRLVLYGRIPEALDNSTMEPIIRARSPAALRSTSV
jgi:hypothetical protein